MKRKIFIMFMIFTLLFVVSCTQSKEPVKGIESSKFEIGDIENIKINVPKANIRSGADSGLPAIDTANKNEKFDVLGQIKDWYAVQLPNNKIGFVPTKDCRPIVDEKESQGNLNANIPNIDISKLPSNIPDLNNNNVPKINQNNTPNTTNDLPGNTPKDTTPYDSNRDVNQNVNVNNTVNSGLTKAEQQMLNLVNAARKENGVPALKIDLELTDVARLKSQDMIDKNYFSHNSPTYGSPFDMMKEFGIKYVHAGENIAGNSAVDAAHKALMNSPGHRKNILSPDYTHIGIGIKKGGQYGNMFTQMFISKPK